MPGICEGTMLVYNKDSVYKFLQGCPEDSGYRKSVEEWLLFIQKGVLLSEDVKAIEDFIDLGQIEEVIDMVQDEIELSKEYIGSVEPCVEVI